MNWILDNLQLVLIVASAFAWWLTQRKKEREDQDPGAPPPLEDPAAGYDEAERTRRIQEEIRRKIAERHQPGPREPVEAPPLPRRRSEERPVTPPVLVPPLRREAPDWSEQDTATLERQRRFEEQIRTLEQQRREARAQAAFPTAAPAPVMRAPSLGVRAALPKQGADLILALRDRRTLRQAILLREVLGPPVALRTPADER